MKKLFILLAIFTTFAITAQIGINTDGSAANASSILDVKSTTKGLLPPRMTYLEKAAIASPADGLMVWCTNCGANGEMQVYNGVAWTNFSGAAALSMVPDAPTNPLAILPTNTQASVAFTAPAFNGGTAITSYTVTSTPGGITATGTSSPIIVTGLTNGTSYTFKVVATNPAGNSVASVASNAVTPKDCFANVGGTVIRFMCYNLGVTSSTDPYSYQSGNNNGDLYQWGRQTDGHEVTTSATQAGPVTAPVVNKFITVNASPNDWINPQDNNRWLDASKTANDPCPQGYKIPSQAQWGDLFISGITSGTPGTATQNTWTWTGNGYTVGANLYLPAAGYRGASNGLLSNVGTNGFYWSSTYVSSSTFAYNLYFTSNNVDPGNSNWRGRGFSVRCISE